MNDKYTLHYGIHKDTLTSRDSDVSVFDNEDDARQSYRERKEFHSLIGYKIWFAYIILPSGARQTIENGVCLNY